MGYVTNVVNAMIEKGNLQGLSKTRAPGIGQVDKLLAKALGMSRALKGSAAGCASAGDYAKACVKHYGLAIPQAWETKPKAKKRVGAEGAAKLCKFRDKQLGKMGRASSVRRIDPATVDCSAYLERVQGA